MLAISYAERVDLTFGADVDMEKAYWQYVSGWMFHSFGVQPALGRVLAESDDVRPKDTRLPYFRTTTGPGVSGRTQA